MIQSTFSTKPLSLSKGLRDVPHASKSPTLLPTKKGGRRPSPWGRERG